MTIVSSAARNSTVAGNEGVDFFHGFIRLYFKAECTTVSLFNPFGPGNGHLNSSTSFM